MKRLLIVRLGGIGDLLFVTPVLPLLKRDGWHVSFLMKKGMAPVYANCPYIDEYLWHDETVPLGDLLTEYLAKVSVGYDKVVNLSASIEVAFLHVADSPAYYGDKSFRATDENYYNATLKLFGYESDSPVPTIWISDRERKWLKLQRKEYGSDTFLVYWVLSGSSRHKAWPFAEDVGKELLDKYPEMVIMTNGDIVCQLLESWGHKRAVHKSGTWGLRSSLLFARIADLVIGPETGIVNSVGGVNVPKIVMLTHSNHNNLTKYYKNVYPIQSEAVCSPCHRLVTEDMVEFLCSPDKELGAARCSMCLRPETVKQTVEQVFAKWQTNN